MLSARAALISSTKRALPSSALAAHYGRRDRFRCTARFKGHDFVQHLLGGNGAFYEGEKMLPKLQFVNWLIGVALAFLMLIQDCLVSCDCRLVQAGFHALLLISSANRVKKESVTGASLDYAYIEKR